MDSQLGHTTVYLCVWEENKKYYTAFFDGDKKITKAIITKSTFEYLRSIGIKNNKP